jgi:serine/threonine-protein kinase HipA
VLAQDIGLNNTNPQLETINEQHCLIVERYDRTTQDDGTIERIHQEDACQALGINHEGNRGRGKYQSFGGPSYRQVAGLLYDHAEDPDVDIPLLAQYMAYTRVIGNADAHGKNVAVLHRADGRTTLAPIYDTVPTVLWPKLRPEPAMAIGTARTLNDVSHDDLVAETEEWRGSSAAKKSAIKMTLEAIESASVEHEQLSEQIDTAFKDL